jgi:hypothetical protein
MKSALPSPEALVSNVGDLRTRLVRMSECDHKADVIGTTSNILLALTLDRLAWHEGLGPLDEKLERETVLRLAAILQKEFAAPTT